MASSNTLQPDPVLNETQRRGRLVIQALLILFTPLILGLTAGLLINIMAPESHKRIQSLYEGPLPPIVFMVVVASIIVILVRFQKPTISAVILLGIWAFLAAIGSLSGGIMSMGPAMWLALICCAGLLIDIIGTISLAGIATVLLGCITWLDYHKLAFRPWENQADTDPKVSLIAFAFWTVMIWTVASLTSLFAGNLQRALRRSRTQARELQTLTEHLEARVAEQTAQLLEQERETATLDERTRLARDIHDTLAQGLTGIVVQLGAAQQLLALETDVADQQIDLAQRLAREALAEARRSVWNLRSPMLERGDLSDALRSIVAHATQHGTVVHFREEGEPWPLHATVDSALLRVAQEGLANIAKHAEATNADVILAYTPESIQLRICDNGRGFDPDAISNIPSPLGGFGLLGMRERLSALGGTLNVQSNQGVTVIATVPRFHEELVEVLA